MINTYVHGQKVFVYFNLHKKLFSVRDHATGLVVGHTDMIALENVTFKVSEAGRQRVLREKRKNVHAGVMGTVKDFPCPVAWSTAFYNPYKYESFVDINGQKLSTASLVVLIKRPKAQILFNP
jgi:hypothetical protein